MQQNWQMASQCFPFCVQDMGVGQHMMMVQMPVGINHPYAMMVANNANQQETHGHDTHLAANRIWELSRDTQGCHQVQTALDNATDDEQAAIANQLRGRVWDALQCRNANHVLQKCIATMRPQPLQFIIDEIMSPGPGSGAHAAQHRFGCRVVERLLEHCRPDQVKPLVDDILTNGPMLCMDPYGNYVVQHLLEYGTAHYKHSMSMIVAKQIASMPGDYHCCAVVSAALCHSLPDDKVVVSRAVLSRRGLLVSLARQRHGHDAVLTLLGLVNTREKAEAERQLHSSIVQLRKSRYGRVMAKILESSSTVV